MTEDDTFRYLKASVIIPSEYGGYYYFVPNYKVKSTDINDIWGKIYCCGKIYDIIRDKEKDNRLFTDWLSERWKQERIVERYAQMCEIYARHITTTWPEPGLYWNWKENDRR